MSPDNRGCQRDLPTLDARDVQADEEAAFTLTDRVEYAWDESQFRPTVGVLADVLELPRWVVEAYQGALVWAGVRRERTGRQVFVHVRTYRVLGTGEVRLQASKKPCLVCYGAVYELGAGDENRTRVICLEGRGFTIKLRPRAAVAT